MTRLSSTSCITAAPKKRPAAHDARRAVGAQRPNRQRLFGALYICFSGSISRGPAAGLAAGGGKRRSEEYCTPSPRQNSPNPHYALSLGAAQGLLSPEYHPSGSDPTGTAPVHVEHPVAGVDVIFRSITKLPRHPVNPGRRPFQLDKVPNRGFIEQDFAFFPGPAKLSPVLFIFKNRLKAQQLEDPAQPLGIPDLRFNFGAGFMAAFGLGAPLPCQPVLAAFRAQPQQLARLPQGAVWRIEDLIAFEETPGQGPETQPESAAAHCAQIGGSQLDFHLTLPEPSGSCTAFCSQRGEVSFPGPRSIPEPTAGRLCRPIPAAQ